MEVLNETADYYRYLDATEHAEFLYHGIAETVEHDLPDEFDYLEAFDRFPEGVARIVVMPERQIHLSLRRARGRREVRPGDLHGRGLGRDHRVRANAMSASAESIAEAIRSGASSLD